MDGTTLICSVLDIQEAASLMNAHHKVISKWTVDNRMALNLSKVFCNVVQCTRPL